MRICRTDRNHSKLLNWLNLVSNIETKLERYKKVFVPDYIVVYILHYILSFSSGKKETSLT